MADQSANPVPGSNPEDPNIAAHRAKAALGYLCGHLQQINEELQETSPGVADLPLLHDLRQAVAMGQPYGSALAAIHNALLDAGDALGLYGRCHPDTRGLVRDGFDTGLETSVPPRLHDKVYLCPTRQCSRYTWPQPGSAPQCAMTNQPMREDYL
jgi:hypothetical protein